MNTIQEHSDRIKALRGEKATLILDLRANRARRQMIDKEIE